jgi:hypothetical protein
MKTFQILSLFLIIGNNLLSQSVDYVDENYMLIKTEQSWGIRDDSTNKWIVNPIKFKIEGLGYDWFSNGLCPIRVNGKRAYINSKGNVEFQTDFDKIYHFSSGTAIIEKNNKLGLINTKGELITKIEFDINELSHHHNSDKYNVLFKNKSAILVDKSGKEIINNSNFSEIGYFSQTSESEYFSLFFTDGLCRVFQNGKVGFVNETGVLVIPCIYDYCKPFNNGIAPVSKNGKWGMINKNNKCIVPFDFDELSNWHNYYGAWSLDDDKYLDFNQTTYFNKGLCPAAKNINGVLLWGFINPNGQIKIPFKYDLIGHFSMDGFALIHFKGEEFYINTEGVKKK